MKEFRDAFFKLNELTRLAPRIYRNDTGNDVIIGHSMHEALPVRVEVGPGEVVHIADYNINGHPCLHRIYNKEDVIRFLVEAIRSDVNPVIKNMSRTKWLEYMEKEYKKLRANKK